MWLLDTHVISELRKAGTGQAHPRVVAWASSVPLGSLFISVITELGLELGVLQMERRDPAQGRLLRQWLNEQVIPAFRDRVLPVDSAVALRCARLHVPDPRAERDALIAATALVHRMAVVTRNTHDFDATGVEWLDPWA